MKDYPQGPRFSEYPKDVWAWYRRRGRVVQGLIAGVLGLLLIGSLAPSPEDGPKQQVRTEAPSDDPPPIKERISAAAEETTTTVAPTTTTEAPTTTTTAAATLMVRSVTDGDTLAVSDGRTVRLAQVDAPEVRDCYGSQSTAALTALAAGKPVELRRTRNGPEKDRYGRTLADVWIDGRSVNEQLVRDGAAEWGDEFAREDADIARRLQAAEADAKAARRGLWAACGAPTAAAAPAPAPAPTPAPAPQPAPKPAAGSCTASVSNSSPTQNSTVVVSVTSNVPSTPFTATANYKSKDTTQSGTTNGQGSGSVSFMISRATPGYEVVVEVDISGKASCSTSFTPR